MITVEGRYGVKASILVHSLAESSGIELPTWEIEYPRIVLAELNTHGVLAKNSSSSRAIPFSKMKPQLTGRPVEFGANQSGMVAGAEHSEPVIIHGQAMTPEEAWDYGRRMNIDIAEAFSSAGYHKQIFNRFTEAYQMMKTVISGTEVSNFFWLRNDGAADPTLHELAHVMRESLRKSVPQILRDGEWHLPYLSWHRETPRNSNKVGPQVFTIQEGSEHRRLTIEEALKVSSARTAAVSYRNDEYGLEQSDRVYQRLVGDERKHSSATEHQATPIKKSSLFVNNKWLPSTWEKGVSHKTRDGQLWSGRFRGWVQHRKLIPGENYTGAF